jgi:DNA/RNA endonuclease YhcR with UshA esterase domain
MFNKLFRQVILIGCTILFLLYPYKKTFAWGPEGHAIVGRLAMQFVTEDVKKNVLAVLGNISIDTAANWMDIMKSNSNYDFMRSWHFLDFPKDKIYEPNNNDNIVNRLILTYNELNHKNTLCTDQVQKDLFILLHLMGDLHMPLHTGYDDDLGGNKVMVQYDSIKTHNLHRFWDEDIIALAKITDKDCLNLYKSGNIVYKKEIDFLQWMKESRSLLDGVYDYPGFMLSKAYLNKNKIVVQKQLLLAGLRLANVLNNLFASAAPTINFEVATTKYTNGIDINDAIKNIGKKVTVCAAVYDIKSSSNITRINLGAKYPNSPLTIIIFERSYKNFSSTIEELYKNKNICVKGKIEDYKGKAEITIESPENIVVL